MPLYLYRPLDLQIEPFLIHIKAEMPWIKIVESSWPDKDPYRNGLQADIQLDRDVYAFYPWVACFLRWPALIFTNRQIRVDLHAVAPATGVTKWPFAIVTTSYTSLTSKVPPEVVARSVIHEVTHLARFDLFLSLGKDAITDLDRNGHCPSVVPCVLNSGAGMDQAGVEAAILQRPVKPGCNSCDVAWRLTRSSPLWTEECPRQFRDVAGN